MVKLLFHLSTRISHSDLFKFGKINSEDRPSFIPKINKNYKAIENGTHLRKKNHHSTRAGEYPS